ncbi:MAG: trypsin-like serine protease [Archangium sp.]|nr:trypsin-like serine protease [Archangium sp.]MDP3574563.1 trypsin-like serine protease [Archangium sp.]
MPTRLEQEALAAWPFIVQVRAGTEIGTGALVDGRRLLTALHIFRNLDTNEWISRSAQVYRGTTNQTIRIAEGYTPPAVDISLLEAFKHEHHPPMIRGLAEGNSRLRYHSFGYRWVNLPSKGVELRLLPVTGFILAVGEDGRLELSVDQDSQIRGGTSGAPIVVKLGEQSYIAGVIEGRPGAPGTGNEEELYYGIPIDFIHQELDSKNLSCYSDVRPRIPDPIAELLTVLRNLVALCIGESEQLRTKLYATFASLALVTIWIAKSVIAQSRDGIEGNGLVGASVIATLMVSFLMYCSARKTRLDVNREAFLRADAELLGGHHAAAWRRIQELADSDQLEYPELLKAPGWRHVR